jgi:plasmid stability protein
MRTTLDLPDDLMRAVKIRAAQEDSKLKDLIENLLRRALALGQGPSASTSSRPRLPLVECRHAARPGEEMTPERVAAALLAEEALSLNSTQSKR